MGTNQYERRASSFTRMLEKMQWPNGATFDHDMMMQSVRVETPTCIATFDYGCACGVRLSLQASRNPPPHVYVATAYGQEVTNFGRIAERLKIFTPPASTAKETTVTRRDGELVEDFHERWRQTMAAAGWTWSIRPEKERMQHTDLLPWHMLPQETKVQWAAAGPTVGVEGP